MKPAVPDPPEVHHQLWEGFGGSVGWDIGANCGQTLPEMLDRFTHVYAFEPAMECHPYLSRFAGVNWLPLGLSDVNENIDLIALPDKIDTGQLVTAGTHGMEWDPDAPGAVTRTVTCRTVDSLIAEGTVYAPDFMKIDVEGHELKVLFGARVTLSVQRPKLLIEFHSQQLHEDCKALLSSFGYELFTVRHPHYPPGSDLWFGHGWLRATQASNTPTDT